MNHNTNNHATAPTRSRVELIRKVSGTKYSQYLRIISAHQGILTDEISRYIKSNNQHNASQRLNEIIIPLGWVIAKFHAGNPCKSWRWYLMPVTKALKLGIDKRLRLKIYRLLEAANDE